MEEEKTTQKLVVQPEPELWGSIYDELDSDKQSSDDVRSYDGDDSRSDAARSEDVFRQMIVAETNKFHVKPDEVLIGLWPHGSTTPGDEQETKKQKEHIEYIVGLFVIAWLCVFLFQVMRGTIFNLLVNFKGIFAFMLIPLFTMVRGSSHLRLGEYGIQLLSMNVASKKMRKRMDWSDMTRIYLDGKVKPTALDQSLCFESKSGEVIRVKLRKIANRSQWNALLDGLRRWSGFDISELDQNVFDSVSHDRTSPTYTMLWLEALAAPPKRERMNPLDEGTLLCQGRYKLLRRLGAGGQGSAYLASSTVDDSKIVLKEYILPIYVDMKARKQALERFENEAKMLTSLNHPAIVKLNDYFVDDHRAYLVLEYIDGDNLQRHVEKNGPLSSEQACRFANQMIDILSYLHGQAPPVVHRDFTPDNLIVSSDGTIKLIDFMVAQQADASQPASTTVGTVVGKHAYMAPEQFRGQNRTGSDIYAFGCTLYYLLTGVEPEPITQLHPLLKNDSSHPVFNDIVSRCTEADVADRYGSADEIRRELSLIAADIAEV